MYIQRKGADRDEAKGDASAKVGHPVHGTAGVAADNGAADTYMYICMYIYIYTHTYTHTHTHTHTHTCESVRGLASCIAAIHRAAASLLSALKLKTRFT